MEDPRYYTGSDDRDYGSGDGMRSTANLFWRSFNYFLNHSEEDARDYIDQYRSYALFAPLVQEADRRLAALRKDVA